MCVDDVTRLISPFPNRHPFCSLQATFTKEGSIITPQRGSDLAVFNDYLLPYFACPIKESTDNFVVQVLRDGQWQEQDAAILVPGDIISIKLGDIIPADARLLEGDPLKIDQVK